MNKLKFQVKQILKMVSQHVIFPLIYNLNRGKKIDGGKVIFADAHHEKCPPHMELLKKQLVMSGLRVEEYFFDLAGLGTWSGMKKMMGFMRRYATAKAVILCDNFLPVASCKKKKATRVIQLWHGCGAFKQFGYDSEDDIPKGYKGNVYKNYDLVTVSGTACVPYFCSAMRLGGAVVKPIGVSATDKLFRKDYMDACKARFRYMFPDAAGKTVVLYAPTFRENAAHASLVGEEEIDKLIACCGDKIYIIKSFHPHIIAGSGRKALPMTTEELLCCADILITDYSSIFFEFLLEDRPIIFFAPDYDKYEGDRGYYLDYNSLPGQVIKNVTGDEAVHALKSALGTSDAYGAARKLFREAYMDACDGRATERLTKYIMRFTNKE
ncbi:MAG: CDP-glycerol glycerophosphotransferase family protein [Clostridium sp.]|nr:CDP-glycerol glycerophosphotransferase family protein [Clostridium sp.]MCM1399812.1 CDP-glycerol glycerophosphotransferase family protein [Clostridium sp.]MCM1459561.1 CDP-glycerol glycerophosphotransferase family protein [Bacteroides sp.]